MNDTDNTPKDDALADEVAGQHAQIGVSGAPQPGEAFQRTSHPDAQWFENAALGLFIHWGISSVSGEGDLSWSMIARQPDHRKESEERYGAQAVQKISTPEAYWAQAKCFQPQRYDPHKWLAAAKSAGFRYAVLTTKHHDGYTLWPSQFGGLGTQTHLGGRDLVADYVQACRDHDLKVGFYYSPPDWFFEKDRMSFHYGATKPALNTRHEPTKLERRAIGAFEGTPDEEQRRYEDSFRRHIRGHVEELLTRYGKIDLLWFDGFAHDAISIERIRELQPGIVINPRGHLVGDFATSECSFPKTRPEGWWEYCHLWADGAWGYLNHEIYKPTGWMLSEFAKARSWGGNFLPNVCPNADGELPEVAYRRFSELKAWMEHSGESMLNVEAGPWPEQSDVPVTVRGNVWYLHALLASPNTLKLRGGPAPERVSLLRTGDALEWLHDGELLTVEIPGRLRTTQVDVVKLTWPALQSPNRTR